MGIDIGYSRKSSEQEDRQVLSLDSQENELHKLALALKVKGLPILKEAKSAKAPGRPLFDDMVSKIESGEISRIFAWHPDRLSRNSVDTGKLVYLFDLGLLQEIVTPSQTFKNTPMDKFMLSMICNQAKMENDNKSINVVRGLKTKAEKGWLPSGAKPGYMNDKFAEKGNKTTPTDPERFILIRKTWDLVLTGSYGPLQALRMLNEEWGYRIPKHKKICGKPMTRSYIYKMLTDPFYYGEFEYPVGSGILYKGKHQPMITKEEFDRVQIFLGVKGRPRPKTHEFTYPGLLRCGECNAMVGLSTNAI
jgi:DNA invertase Pin-like site-specific DNA recombinase